ncbi:hypothetical protein CWT12_08945 [Actinomyces sp. 432]|nr:hypothetical protein CWT12_08945 [Actinomyces sp. 432]
MTARSRTPTRCGPASPTGPATPACWLSRTCSRCGWRVRSWTFPPVACRPGTRPTPTAPRC